MIYPHNTIIWTGTPTETTKHFVGICADLVREPDSVYYSLFTFTFHLLLVRSKFWVGGERSAPGSGMREGPNSCSRAVEICLWDLWRNQVFARCPPKQLSASREPWEAYSSWRLYSCFAYNCRKKEMHSLIKSEKVRVLIM